MRKMTCAWVLAASGLLLTADWSEAKDFSWQSDLAPGRVLTVRGVRGNITAELAQGRRAAVTGIEKGSAAQLENVEVRVVEEGGNVTICAVYPGNNRCPGARDGGSDNEKNDVTIDFVVRVPAGVHLVADTEIGKVQAKSMAGPVKARTVIGDIEVSTADYVQAESVNGDIEATLGKTRWTGAVKFETINGDIVVRLPTGADTELLASTTTGSFRSDLFPTEENRYGIPGADVRGTLGGGGRTLEIATTNGSIQVKRAQ